MADAPVDFCTSVFPATDDLILSRASQLVAQLKARHYYTDTQNFDLRCQVCKVGLKGEKGAREHAMQTGRESTAAAAALVLDGLTATLFAQMSTLENTREIGSIFFPILHPRRLPCAC